MQGQNGQDINSTERGRGALQKGLTPQGPPSDVVIVSQAIYMEFASYGHNDP